MNNDKQWYDMKNVSGLKDPLYQALAIKKQGITSRKVLSLRVTRIMCDLEMLSIVKYRKLTISDCPTQRFTQLPPQIPSNGTF